MNASHHELDQYIEPKIEKIFINIFQKKIIQRYILYKEGNEIKKELKKFLFSKQRT